MADPMDQPENDSYGLVYPFVVCASKGGPYDDEAFVAGVTLGQIDRSLEVAAVAGADRLQFTVNTGLVKQLELCGMARGFPVMTATATDYPTWTFVTFQREADADG